MMTFLPLKLEGKIQISMLLRVHFTYVIFYDILNKLSRPDRLRSIADRFNLDQEAVLDNVLYARAYTSKYRVAQKQKMPKLSQMIRILMALMNFNAY